MKTKSTHRTNVEEMRTPFSSFLQLIGICFFFFLLFLVGELKCSNEAFRKEVEAKDVCTRRYIEFLRYCFNLVLLAVLNEQNLDIQFIKHFISLALHTNTFTHELLHTKFRSAVRSLHLRFQFLSLNYLAKLIARKHSVTTK